MQEVVSDERRMEDKPFHYNVRKKSCWQEACSNNGGGMNMNLDEAFVKALAIRKENEMVFPQSKYPWTNEAAIVDMIMSCRTEDDYALISELFKRLNDNIVDDIQCYALLCEMAVAIKKNETEGEHTAICVMRTKNDPEADSSQAVVNDLKMAMTIAGGFEHSYSAVCFEEIEGLYKKKGYRHFIVVDDFIGSGKTVDARYRYFLKRHLTGATISFYFLAGMAKGLSYCKNKNIPVHCCKIMYKGINGHYHKEELLKRIWSMRYMESLLGDESGTVKLKDNCFGYGQAEALYCRQFRNIPNSVFPIFWWNVNKDGSKRQSVFTRVQYGY